MRDTGGNREVFRRSSNALFADVGDDIVALNVEKGRTYGMENVAASVWALLDRPTTLEQLSTKLVERYDVELDDCRREVAWLLGQLEREGLVERA